MSKQPITKTYSVKFVGSKRGIENGQILPGTTVADVLTSLNLNNSYQLSDAKNAAAVYRPTDDLYAMIDDGALLYASALVDAGV